MARSTFKVLFYLKRQSEKNGKVPVMGRITVNGTISQFSCKLNVREALWDTEANKAAGKSVEAQRINEKLENIKTNIGKQYQRISDRDSYVTAEKVKNAWISRKCPDGWVKYGLYEMRLMDKVLIEAGFVTGAVVKWWGCTALPLERKPVPHHLQRIVESSRKARTGDTNIGYSTKKEIERAQAVVPYRGYVEREVGEVNIVPTDLVLLYVNMQNSFCREYHSLAALEMRIYVVDLYSLDYSLSM